MAELWEWLVHAFWYPLTLAYFQKALLAGVLVAIPCAVLGCLVVLRRMAFLGDALTHAMLAGVSIGYLVMAMVFDVHSSASAMVIGALLAALLTIALIGGVSHFTRVKDDTAIGIMYTAVFAVGAVLVSLFQKHIHIDIMHFFVGNVLGVADSDIWLAAIAGALVLSLTVLFFRQLQLTSFDPVMAASIGVPVLFISYALTTGVSLVVVSGVPMVGVVMVVGLLITPAATAYLLCERLSSMMWLAALFGTTSVIGGMYVTQWISAAGGGVISLFAAAQFLAVFLCSPRHGLLARWWRLRTQVSQALIEDVLGDALRVKREQITPAEVASAHGYERSRVQRACLQMVDQSLLEQLDDGAFRLSEAGRAEAIRVRRSHRLWETYLHELGTPDDELHARAHQLEHVNDPQALAYLDDLLGHPIRDPHGSVIPRAPTSSDQPMPVSLLRAGDRGEVAILGPRARGLDLPLGEEVTVGTRGEDGLTWTVSRDDGAIVRLAHDEADAVLLRVLARGTEAPPA